MQQVLNLQGSLEAQVSTAVQRMLLKLNVLPLSTVHFKVSELTMPVNFFCELLGNIVSSLSQTVEG